jgi:hypothetical protein
MDRGSVISTSTGNEKSHPLWDDFFICEGSIEQVYGWEQKSVS